MVSFNISFFSVFFVNWKLHLDAWLASVSDIVFKQCFICCSVYFLETGSYCAADAGAGCFHCKVPHRPSFYMKFLTEPPLMVLVVTNVIAEICYFVVCWKMVIFFLLSIKSVAWPRFPPCYWLLLPLLFPPRSFLPEDDRLHQLSKASGFGSDVLCCVYFLVQQFLL